MAETRILYQLLIVSSLLSVSNADVEPINFCSDSNEPQVLNAIYYGVITHNGNTDKWCNRSLDGSDYIYTNNPYLAIANIVNSTECPSNENIYVNGKKFCIRESVTSLEVFPLNISTSVNISIPQEAAPFTLHYYNAILLCTTHPEIEDKITADGNDKLPKLYVSNGYVSFANHFPKDTCFLDIINEEVGNVGIELVWSTLQTSTNISNSFTWSRNSQLPYQDYTAISTDQKLFQLKFTQWKQNSTDKIFIRVSTPCPAPESVSNGAFYSLKSRDQYIPGHELDYICKKGVSKASEVLVCQHNGSWSPTPPCTVPAPCPAPESVSNGAFYSLKSRHQYIPGHELDYICKKGFSKASEVLVCQHNGSWSPTPPCTVQEESETMDNGQWACTVSAVNSGVLLLALICVCVAVCWHFRVDIIEWVRARCQKCRGALPGQSDDTSTNVASSSTGEEPHVDEGELQDVIVNGSRSHGSRSTRKNKGSKKRKRGK